VSYPITISLHRRIECLCLSPSTIARYHHYCLCTIPYPYYSQYERCIRRFHPRLRWNYLRQRIVAYGVDPEFRACSCKPRTYFRISTFGEGRSQSASRWSTCKPVIGGISELAQYWQIGGQKSISSIWPRYARHPTSNLILGRKWGTCGNLRRDRRREKYARQSLFQLC
jgi:hypothetical protein